MGVYTNTPFNADCILFNSHQNLHEVLRYKIKYQDKIFLHRIDGPISKYRGRNVFLDKLIFLFAQQLADGVIFQSKWSLEASKKLGYTECHFQEVIHNASDPSLFYPAKNPLSISQKKIKLIATSWSINMKKGFDIYAYIDTNLNFNEYEFTFIGNSPVKFKNIKCIEPLSSKEIGRHLRESHILVFASELESCSNSIIEALSCGLPIVYRKTSSNSEIVKQAGLPFSSSMEAIEAIGNVKENYEHFQNAIDILPLRETAEKYFFLAQRVYKEKLAGCYFPKKTDNMFFLKYILLTFFIKMNNLFYRISTKMKK